MDGSLFPLDRAGRLTRDVVGHAVHAAHLVDDKGGDAAEEGVLERGVVGGRGDGAQRAGLVVGAAVAHHADGADRQQHGEGLPDLVVEAGLAEPVEMDGSTWCRRLGFSRVTVETMSARDARGPEDSCFSGPRASRALKGLLHP